MGNLVEFLVKVKDHASGPLGNIAASGSKSFSKLNNNLFSTNQKVNFLGGAVLDVDRKLNSLGRTRSININTSGITRASNELDKLNQKIERASGRGRNGGGLFSGNGGRSGGMGMLGNMPLGGVTGAITIGAIGAGLGKIAGDGMERGATNMRFGVMAGETEGGKLSKNLTDFANKSIYGNEVFTNAQTMMAFDINAKKVMPTVRMLGDVAMGNAERMGALTLAFSQVNAAGKLTGQDLLQFVNAGFNPLQEMSKKTGKSMAVLREEMSAGKITFNQVEDAFKSATSSGGRFYNMTEKLNNTTFGKWQAFKGSLSGLSAELGQSWSPFLNNLFDAGNSMTSFISDNRYRLGSLFDPLIDSTKPLNSIFDDISNRIGNMNNPDSLNSVFSGVKNSLDTITPVIRGLSEVTSTLYKSASQIASAYQKSGYLKESVDKVIFRASKGGADFWNGTESFLTNSAKAAGNYGSGILMGDTDLVLQGHRNLGNAVFGSQGSAEKARNIRNANDWEQLSAAWNPEAIERDKIAAKRQADGFMRFVRPTPYAQLKAGSGFSDLFGAGFGSQLPQNLLTDKTSLAPPPSALDTAKGISGGGLRNITINVSKFFDDLHFQSGSTDTGVNDIENRMVEMFLRVVNSANSMAN